MRTLSFIRQALSHPAAYILMLFLAGGITWLGKEVEGAIAFVMIISLYLIVFDDLISTMLPFLLICTFTLKCYDSFDTFMAYKWFAIPAVISVVFHFAVYRKKFSVGENFFGVCAVAAAVTLGGLFSITPEEYFSGSALYHVFALGIGMIFGYLVIRASLNGRPIEESTKRFCAFMYLWGVFAAYMVFQFVYINLDVIIAEHKIPDFQWSNNISTVLMFAMPFPFYYGLKKWWHLIPGYLMYIAIMITSSRGGMVFGTAEIAILTVYVLFASRKIVPRVIAVLVPLISGLAIYNNMFDVAKILNFDKFFGNDDFIDSGEARVVLIKRSIEDFKSNVLFGRGLGYQGNKDAYDPKKGALHFYHMMIPQVIGSMGLLGVFAYLSQFIMRVRSMFRRISDLTMCLFISYLGLFMMSQVNPGEFVPLPYSLIAVSLFIIIELQPLNHKKTSVIDVP